MSSTASLSGRLALITGCTGGIGRATAILLAQQGCSVAVHHSSDASKPKADALVAELTQNYGVRAAAFRADLSSYEEAKRLHTEVVQQLGHPDIFFGNHGATLKTIGPTGNIQDISPDMFEQTWRLNTGTNFYLIQLCIPHMEDQKWGRIILTSSVAAITGGIIGPHYASSKSAMHGLIHWLSLRYAKDGICSNAVAPALIEDTDMISNPTDEMRSKIPVGRLGKPHEIASIVLMLVQNAYMTNKVIAADGGWSSGGI